MDGGANVDCDPSTQHCCETPAGGAPTMCVPTATACGASDVDWQCEDPTADCRTAGSPVCCAPGASIGLGMPVGTCGNFAHKMTHTTCVANAAACAGIVMCTNNTQCPTGQTCTPFGKAGNQVGGCM